MVLMDELFINKWHEVKDILPIDQDEIFFYTNGIVYAGKYDEESHIFYMADYLGYEENKVKAWKYIKDLNYSSFPENGARVAVATEDFDCYVTGTYNEDYDRLGAVILDAVYKLPENTSDIIKMEDILAWAVVPSYEESVQEALGKTKASHPGTAKASWEGSYKNKETSKEILRDFPGKSVTAPSGDLGKTGHKKAFPGKKWDITKTPKNPKKASNSSLDSHMGSVSSDGSLGSSKKNPTKAKVGKIKTNNLGIPEYDMYTGVKFSNKRSYRK